MAKTGRESENIEIRHDYNAKLGIGFYMLDFFSLIFWMVPVGMTVRLRLHLGRDSPCYVINGFCSFLCSPFFFRVKASPVPM